MPLENDQVYAYFSNLNPLCRKICTALHSDDCPHISRTPNGYSEESNNLLDMFKIKCGEKILVDFENDDGWTWRDEHSGPFSWMTRSQQDLTTIDDEEGPPVTKADVVSSKRATIIGQDEVSKVGGLSEIQAAFQKFGISSVDESQDNMPPTLEHADYVAGSGSGVSSLEVSPVHKPQTQTRKWSTADKSDTEGDECLITADVHSDGGTCSLAFDMNPVDMFTAQVVTSSTDTSFITDTTEQNEPSQKSSENDFASYTTKYTEDGYSTQDISEKSGHTTPKNESFTDIIGYDNPAVSPDDVPKSAHDNSMSAFDSWDTESNKVDTSEVTKTGFDFLDNW